jgi:aldehyde:ferredoxin oxidoreductase
LNKTGPKILPDNPDMPGLANDGTATVVMFQNTIGSLPTRNYSEGQFEHCEDISGETMSATVLKGRDTCYACVVRCKRVVEITEGAYKVDPKYGGAEYETLSTFGSYCGVNDLAAINLANQMCNEHGVDTIAAGATIAFAIECFENGVITKEQTGGLELKYGDADAMLKALEMMLNAEGEFGRTLGMGSERAAKAWGNGADEFLITVKGAEAPAHMPQAKRSLGLIYAVNPFGADHQSSEHDPYYEEGVADLNLDRLKMLGLSEPQPGLSLTKEKVRFRLPHRALLLDARLGRTVPVRVRSRLDAVRSGRDGRYDQRGHRLGCHRGGTAGGRRAPPEPVQDLQCPRGTESKCG